MAEAAVSRTWRMSLNDVPVTHMFDDNGCGTFDPTQAVTVRTGLKPPTLQVVLVSDVFTLTLLEEAL